MKAGPAEKKMMVAEQAIGASLSALITPGPTLGFCVPPNESLLTYWDTVEDRLDKIRHCQNIEGVERQLAPFDPPIDPMLLVRAAAAGLDLSSVLSDLAAPTSTYRFTTMLQKANELCAEVRSLGAALLAALEKRDGERLALLRATHERGLLQAVKQVKALNAEEAQAQIDALQRAMDLAAARKAYYSAREYMNAAEEAHMVTMGYAGEAEMAASLCHQTSTGAHSIPDADAGPTGMGAHATVKTGGSKEGDAADAFGKFLTATAKGLQTGSSIAGMMGGFDRRIDDWLFQAALADLEMEQIAKQSEAANIRLSAALAEIDSHQLQIDQSAEMEEALRSKYTNEDLYSWTISQLSSVYFQAYKLAYDLAKRAERCYQFERGLTNSGFIQFGYWDRLQKGLLAGERLALDLRRLEVAWMDANRREYEITRQVSLVLHDPAQLLALRMHGVCEIVLPEEFFDADYPGHYFRRIKTVSVTVACVAGPYTPVNCTLTLLSSKIRFSSNPGDNYQESLEGANGDARILYNFTSVQSVATSHGQGDAGLFELSFRDERYLPFEGAGAVSRWRLSMPRADNAFDFNSLSDVVLKVSYTARDGGERLRRAARTALQNKRKDVPEIDDPSTGLRPAAQRLFSLRNEYAAEWAKLRAALRKEGTGSITLDLGRERFPYWCRSGTLTIVEVEVLAEGVPRASDEEIQVRIASLLFVTGGGDTDTILDDDPARQPTVLDPTKGMLGPVVEKKAELELKVETGAALAVAIKSGAGLRDLWVRVAYTHEPPKSP